MARYDWATIKAEYETGLYSMEQLADKHGFNAGYARNKAAKENWDKGRTSNKIAEIASKKVLDRIGKTEADIKKELYDTVLMIESKMQGEWDNAKPNFDILKATKISTEILQNIMDMKYELADIQKVAKRIEQDVDGKLDIPTTINILDARDKDDS